MIVITGATGNTGSHVAERLRRNAPDRPMVALVRAGSDTRHLRSIGLRTHVCDLADPPTYLPVFEPGATFVGVANLRLSDGMLPHLLEARVAHAHFVTTTTVFSGYRTYGEPYRQIESRLSAPLELPTSLLRPSMIYGNARDRNMSKLIRVLGRTPVFPVFGPGTALMQPVFVEDLADGIVTAVERGATGAYNLAGSYPIDYNALLGHVARALGRRVRLVHVNHRLAADAVRVLRRVPRFPIRHEQVMRLLEDKAFDISRSIADLDYAPRAFVDGIQLEVDELRRSRTR